MLNIASPEAVVVSMALSWREEAVALVEEFLDDVNSAQRPGRLHDGKVMVMRSNLRWCSDVLELLCWSGETVCIAFVIDAHDREIIAWRAVVGMGISGSQVRDLMLETVEKRFGTLRAPMPVEWLSDNGSPYTAKDTRDFATQLNLVSCFTPVASPESNGLAEAFCAHLQARLCAPPPPVRRRHRARAAWRVV